MPVIDTSLVLLLSDQIVRQVFKEIVKNRSAVFKDLRDSLAKSPGVPDDQIETAVSRLKSADLIKERIAPIADFNSYYVTADGLTAERQLRLTESNQRPADQ